MVSGFSKFKDKLFKQKDQESYPEDFQDDYVEIGGEAKDKVNRAKVLIRPYIIEDFSDIKPALDSLREGTTIALLNIRPLKEKDIIELKRAVNKLKKTCDAIGGDIAGFGDDWIVVTPGFAQVYRSTQTEEIHDELE